MPGPLSLVQFMGSRYGLMDESMLLLEVTSRSPARRCVYHVHNHQGSGALSLSASMRSSRRPFGFFATGSESDASSSISCHVSLARARCLLRQISKGGGASKRDERARDIFGLSMRVFECILCALLGVHGFALPRAVDLRFGCGRRRCDDTSATPAYRSLVLP